VLLSPLSAPIDTPLFSVSQLISRIEDMSNVLMWCDESLIGSIHKVAKPTSTEMAEGAAEGELAAADFGKALGAIVPFRVELPLLKLSFEARPDPESAQQVRLFSMDHSELFLPVRDPPFSMCGK